MKKLRVAIATLIIIPVLICISHIYLRHVTQTMVNQISISEKSEKADNTLQTKKDLAKFSIEWESNKHLLATFIRHSELDLANQSIAKLIPLADSDDVSGFYAECETLKMQIQHLVDVEKFSFDNIF